MVERFGSNSAGSSEKTDMDADARQKLLDKYKDVYCVVAESLVGAIDEELDVRPAPGKWSARERVIR